MQNVFTVTADVLESVVAEDAPAHCRAVICCAAAALAPSVEVVERVGELMRSDEHLDAPSIAVHLPVHVADALLSARGWTQEVRRGGVAFISPTGKRFWHRDEALTFALTAEAVALGAEQER